MRLARVIDEASVELAGVESVVGTARHVLDLAAETLLDDAFADDID